MRLQESDMPEALLSLVTARAVAASPGATNQPQTVLVCAVP